MKSRLRGGSGSVLPPGFGERLRALRGRSGLRQSDVALLMGNGRTQALVSQLEAGWLVNPTLGLVVEYLRAVRARFSEIADVLDKTTAAPPAGERAAREAVALASAEFGAHAYRVAVRYDQRVARQRALRGERPEPAEKRAARGRNLAAAYAVRRKVERLLWRQMTPENLGAKPELVLCRALAIYGMAVWGALRRLRHPSRAGQRRAIARVEARMRIREIAPKQAVEFVRESAARLARRAGDRMPDSGGRDEG